MPDRNTEAEDKLRKLGERLRQGWARQHPIPEKSLDTVRNAVREEWAREQKLQREQGISRGPAKNRTREPSEPDRDQ